MDNPYLDPNPTYWGLLVYVWCEYTSYMQMTL